MIPRLKRIAIAVSACAAMLVPSMTSACPRCFNSSPNHIGLIVGVIFLLPLPFIIMGAIAWRLCKSRHHAPD